MDASFPNGYGHFAEEWRRFGRLSSQGRELARTGRLLWLQSVGIMNQSEALRRAGKSRRSGAVSRNQEAHAEISG